MSFSFIYQAFAPRWSEFSASVSRERDCSHTTARSEGRDKSYSKYLFQQMSTAGQQLTLVYLPISSWMLGGTTHDKISNHLSSKTPHCNKVTYQSELQTHFWDKSLDSTWHNTWWNCHSHSPRRTTYVHTIHLIRNNWPGVIRYLSIQSLCTWKLCFMTFLYGSSVVECLHTCVQCVCVRKEGNAPGVWDPHKVLLFFRSPVRAGSIGMYSLRRKAWLWGLSHCPVAPVFQLSFQADR